MREFVVTLRSGMRYTVKAERFRFESGYLAFLVTPPAAAANSDPFAGVVGLVEQKQVVTVVDREHLVAEDRCKPHYVTGGDPDIPF